MASVQSIAANDFCSNEAKIKKNTWLLMQQRSHGDELPVNLAGQWDEGLNPQ